MYFFLGCSGQRKVFHAGISNSGGSTPVRGLRLRQPDHCGTVSALAPQDVYKRQVMGGFRTPVALGTLEDLLSSFARHHAPLTLAIVIASYMKDMILLTYTAADA